MDQRHITKRDDGKWQIVAPGYERASYVTDTQREAIERGKQICQNIGAELFIHGKDNKIRERNSYGFKDPYPPRG